MKIKFVRTHEFILYCSSQLIYTTNLKSLMLSIFPTLRGIKIRDPGFSVILVTATMTTDQAVDFLKAEVVSVERLLGLQGELNSATILEAQEGNRINGSSVGDFKGRKARMAYARWNYLLVSDGKAEEGGEYVSKEKLRGVKDALRNEEKGFVEAAACFNQEIESLEGEGDEWEGENSEAGDEEGDLVKRLEEVEEEIYWKRKLYAQLEALEADGCVEDVVMEENQSASEVEAALEQERLCLERDQVSSREDLVGYASLKDLLGRAKNVCGAFGTYEVVAVGRDSLSVKIHSILDETHFTNSQVPKKYTHVLTLGLELPLDTSFNVALSSDAALDPPDISPNELHELLKQLKLKNSSGVPISEFITYVARLLSSKLLRRAAFCEAEKSML